MTRPEDRIYAESPYDVTFPHDTVHYDQYEGNSTSTNFPVKSDQADDGYVDESDLQAVGSMRPAADVFDDPALRHFFLTLAQKFEPQASVRWNAKTVLLPLGYMVPILTRNKARKTARVWVDTTVTPAQTGAAYLSPNGAVDLSQGVANSNVVSLPLAGTQFVLDSTGELYGMATGQMVQVCVIETNVALHR